jgi:hypothetical protein
MGRYPTQLGVEQDAGLDAAMRFGHARPSQGTMRQALQGAEFNKGHERIPG